jgi:hypothetical protein
MKSVIRKDGSDLKVLVKLTKIEFISFSMGNYSAT